MTKPRLIGLAGRKHAGKTTAANYLRERHGYAGSEVTDPMDEMAAPLMRRMGVPDHEIMPRLVGNMKNDPIPGFEWLSGRKIKQAIGREFRDAVGRPDRSGKPDRNFFQTLWEMDNADHPLLVHGSIRYAFEADYIRSRGGIVIMIIDPDAPTDDLHESELMDFSGDYDVENPKDVENPQVGVQHLQAKLDLILGESADLEISTNVHDPITAFDTAIDEALNHHGPAIRRIADRLDNGDDALSEVLDDVASDLKGSLGSSAANQVADDQAEAAHSAAERWVADNVSNSTSDRRVAAAFALLGAASAEERLANTV